MIPPVQARAFGHEASRLLLMAVLLLLLIADGMSQQVFDTAQPTADVRVLSATANARLGFTLASGDLNGDGHRDLILGAPGRRPGLRPGAGSVFVLFGPLLPGVIDLAEGAADVTIVNADTTGALGNAVAAGDVNGDGIDDLVVGAPQKAGRFRQESGVVYVFFGRESWPALLEVSDAAADVEIWGAEFFEHLGTAVAVGNVDGTSPNDLILSSPGASGTAGAASGQVYVVTGSDTLRGQLDLKVTPAATTISGRQSQGFFGSALASADFNGDGIDDVAIGAYKVNVNLMIDAGEVYVVPGGAPLPDSLDLATESADLRILGADRRDHFGFALATGDVNDDGISDLAIGARQADGSPSAQFEAGAVYLLWGKQELPDSLDLQREPTEFLALGPAASGQFGYSLALGDVNGDNRADLLVGAPALDAAERTGAGACFLLSGVDLGQWDLSSRPASVAYLGPREDAALGTSALVADLNSDEVDDLAMGAPDAGGGQVVVFFGDRTVSVESKSDQESGERGLSLFSVYPNPFNHHTRFRIPTEEYSRPIEVRIFDRLGHLVGHLTARETAEGRYEAPWDGTDFNGVAVASGIYLARVEIGSRVMTAKVVLIR